MCNIAASRQSRDVDSPRLGSEKSCFLSARGFTGTTEEAAKGELEFKARGTGIYNPAKTDRLAEGGPKQAPKTKQVMNLDVVVIRYECEFGVGGYGTGSIGIELWDSGKF
jgi:hypothetical protein